MIPGFSDEYIVNSIAHAVELKAIVLELYGTGNLPSRKVSSVRHREPPFTQSALSIMHRLRISFLLHPFDLFPRVPSLRLLSRCLQASLLDALDAAGKKGIAVVASSQCLRGTVDLRAYELGRRLAEIGVISGGDMTTETISLKLAYLLSWPGMTHSQLRYYMGKSLRGEITEVASDHASTADGDVLLTMNDISGATRRLSMDSLPPSTHISGSAGCFTAAVQVAFDTSPANSSTPAPQLSGLSSDLLATPAASSSSLPELSISASGGSLGSARGRHGTHFSDNATNFSGSSQGAAALASPGHVVEQPLHDSDAASASGSLVRNGAGVMSPRASKLVPSHSTRSVL